MELETAGDPISGLKWTHRTTEKIAKELRRLGIGVCKNTVGRLLRKIGFSLRVNHKKLSACSRVDRDAQFRKIRRLRQSFFRAGNPVIAVDSKKKELVGRFKNRGRAWSRKAVQVNDHDFRSLAEGIAIPYGIYDVGANRGFVCVGTSHETPEFAADCIATWWRQEGRSRYPRAKRLLILADGGGGNGSRCQAWKLGVQEKLSNRYGLSVMVSHYPPGTSKWNPVDHRLFSEISKNWAGKPLDSYETVLKYIRTTKTSTGLRVRAILLRKPYQKGIKIPEAKMRSVKLRRHPRMPAWNYTIRPRKNVK
jgi:hypothetical protein